MNHTEDAIARILAHWNTQLLEGDDPYARDYIDEVELIDTLIVDEFTTVTLHRALVVDELNEFSFMTMIRDDRIESIVTIVDGNIERFDY